RDARRDARCAHWNHVRRNRQMIPLVLSVILAGGVYLTFEGLARPRERLFGEIRLTTVRDFLARAGLHDVSPRDFFLFSLGSGACAGVIAQLFLGWGIISALAGAAGLLAPY